MLTLQVVTTIDTGYHELCKFSYLLAPSVFAIIGHLNPRVRMGSCITDELHMIHECPVLQPLRLQYAALFYPDTDTMRSFFAQQDHMLLTPWGKTDT